FDFNGDGRAEVIYGDEWKLYILDGRDGNILYEHSKPSGTFLELPVIADIDSDGRAEIVAIANNGVRDNPNTPENEAETGIYVFGGASNNWVNTRKIWNQHAYHITNVNDDGTIPSHPLNNWLVPGLNNFRQNKPLP